MSTTVNDLYIIIGEQAVEIRQLKQTLQDFIDQRNQSKPLDHHSNQRRHIEQPVKQNG